MSILKDGRAGSVLRIRGNEIPYSSFPMRKSRRWALNPMVYAADPWSLILRGVADSGSVDSPTAESFVRQAREYFVAGDQASAMEARPVLYYYSFLNLTKALAVARKRSGLVGRVEHGIAPKKGSQALLDAELALHPSTPSRRSVFDELNLALGNKLTLGSIPVVELMPQLLLGHRLWCEAANRTERFVAVVPVLMSHQSSKRIWSEVTVEKGHLSKRGLTLKRFLRESELEPQLEAVKSAIPGHYRVQQAVPTPYGHRPADGVMKAVAVLRPKLWRTVDASIPYRRYFVHLAPQTTYRLPQLVSVYAMMFYLGSLSRYRPRLLIDALAGKYGAFLHQFLVSQPTQFVFEVACAIREQEVSRAALV